MSIHDTESSPAAHAPQISVVVASFRARAVLDDCLQSLIPQCTSADIELIVARRDDGSLAEIAAAYPRVRVVAAAADADIPRLRGAGLTVARGQMVALTEDHCVASPEWVAVLTAYLPLPVDVVGGGMDNARPARAVDCGAFFAEYGFFAATSIPARSPSGGMLLTGANVAYRRDTVQRVATWMSAGDWENVVHDRLHESGARLAFEPRARVGQNLTYRLWSFLVDRYEHGRDYARVRLAGAPSTRWRRIAAVPLLPPLLVWRVAHTAADSRERARAFARALPFTFAFLSAWAVGEFVGYLYDPSR